MQNVDSEEKQIVWGEMKAPSFWNLETYHYESFDKLNNFNTSQAAKDGFKFIPSENIFIRQGPEYISETTFWGKLLNDDTESCTPGSIKLSHYAKVPKVLTVIGEKTKHEGNTITLSKIGMLKNLDISTVHGKNATASEIIDIETKKISIYTDFSIIFMMFLSFVIQRIFFNDKELPYSFHGPQYDGMYVFKTYCVCFICCMCISLSARAVYLS